jgi:hypothetical protein
MAPPFLTSALDGGVGPASPPPPVALPGERDPGTGRIREAGLVP